MIYDAHCHIDLMPNMNSIIGQMQGASIGIFAVGTTPKAYERECQFCASHTNIKVGVGLHPQLINERYSEIVLIEQLISRTHYVGEIGLDFNTNYVKSRDLQLRAIEKEIYLCEKFGKKVVSLHSVRSVSSLIDIISKYFKGNCIYILHWFSGTLSQLKRALDLGCYVSVNPAMLKSNSGISIIEYLPFDRILVETDAPFTMSVNSVKDIELSLNQTIDGMYQLIGRDIARYVNDNSEYVFSKY